jgi:hypothetical protein
MTRKEARVAHEGLVARIPESNLQLEHWLQEEGVDCRTGPAHARLDRIEQWLLPKIQATVRPVKVAEGRGRVGRMLANYLAAQEPEPDLDAPSMSMCCYVGYYFGSLEIDSCPDARFTLYTRKGSFYFHRTVVSKPGFLTVTEPTVVTMNTLRGKFSRDFPDLDTSLGDVFQRHLDNFGCR